MSMQVQNRQAQNRQNMMDLVIVGGGVSGLATAHYAQSYWRGGDRPPLKMALYEASTRVGGKVQTELVDSGDKQPFVVEAGPDSFLTQKPWALALARELGMEDDLIGTNDHRRKVYVLQGRKLVQMPEGLQLIVPTRLWPFIKSPLISPLGKLRMGLDLLLPARRDDGDETLAEFVTRRLGQEALDKLAEPLMSGIYSAEADRQSILATFPRFRDLEKAHGSLIRGILAGAAQRRQTGAQTPDAQKRISAFVTPVQGTHELIRRLEAELDDVIHRGIGVERIVRHEENGKPHYTLDLGNGETVMARAVVLAVPAGAAARLLGELAPDAAARLAAIRHVSTVTLTLAYGPGAIAHPMDGFGVMIPRSEQRPVNALTWTTRKFNQRAPDGSHLVRVFLGGSRNPDIVQRDDADLVALAQQELASIMGVTAPPLFHRLFRWIDASPQYDVGHLDQVDAIEADLPKRLYVTGSPYRGIGIPDCVHQAQNTARRLVDVLRLASLTEAGTPA